MVTGKTEAGFRQLLRMTVLIVGMLVIGGEVWGQKTWDGGGDGISWSDQNNWSGNTLPTALESVSISRNVNTTVNVDGNYICAGLTISLTGNDNGNRTVRLNVLNGNNLTVNGIIIISNPSTRAARTKTCFIDVLGILNANGGISMTSTSGDNNKVSSLRISGGTVNSTGNIIMNEISPRNDITFTTGILNESGDISGGTINSGTGTVNYNNSGVQNVGAYTYYNLDISGSGNKTNTTTAFAVNNNLTVTSGNLVLQATNADYIIGNNLTVSAAGTLTHSISWDGAGRLLRVDGNLDIAGVYDYSAVPRAHIQMTGAGARTINTGTSELSILTLQNGNFSATGTVTINDNFWSMFGTGGSFSTNGRSVTARAGVLINGGTVNINGGTLNVTGGMRVGTNDGVAGAVNFSAGTLNTDGLTLGDGNRTGTFTHSGGTANINGNLLINPSCSYTCSNSPQINLGGNFTNNGTFTGASTNISFTGTANQVIDGFTTLGSVSMLKTGGTATLQGNINGTGLTVNGSGGTINLGNSLTHTFTGAFNLSNGTINGGSSTLRLGGTINVTGGNYTANTGTIEYNGGLQNVLPFTHYNLTVSNGNIKNLSSNTRINGTLNLNNGILAIGNYDLTLAPTSDISGTFSAMRMINIGTGSIIKEGNANADFVRTFPIGLGTAYTPVQIHNFSATAIAPNSTVRIQSSATAASGVSGFYPLNRHWITSTTGFSGSVLADISFTYLAGDIPSGGTAASYELLYKPTATGVWGIPGGASASGVTPLRATAATTLDATWTSAEPEKRIFYSLKTGSWDDPTTWTLDPSGTQYLNPNNYTPTTSITAGFDEVVILSGRTVTVSSANKVNKKLTVIGTLDLGITAGHTFASINGSGRIRLAADNFPAGDASDFITAGQGEGTVEYYGTTRNASIPRTYFNVDVNMSAGNTLTLLSDYNINGSLIITNGTFSINNSASTTALNIIVNGNINVESSGNIAVGTANARHQLNIYGNFTNKGIAKFTNRTTANYVAEATDGIVDVNLINSSKDQSIMCMGVTNFYRIKIDKGADYTYTLNIEATAPANFNLFGFANEDHAADVPQLVNNNNALGLVKGSVRIGNSIVIPVLSVANVYAVSEAAQLWIDRGTVQKNSGSNTTVYGKLKITNGLLEVRTNNGITFRDNGILSVEGGTVNTNQIRTSEVGTANYGGYVQTAGTVNVLGGTTNTDYYVFSLPYPQSVFNMSGGVLNVNTSTVNGAILINSSDENIKITGGTVNAETNSTQNFLITSTAPFWNLSLKNSTAVARTFTLGAASNIGPDNVNVPAQPLKVLNDLRLWGKESGGIAYAALTFLPGTNDVYIGGSLYVENGSQYLPVSGGTAPYDAIANQPTARNTTYFYKTAGTAMVEELYNGNNTNQIEFGNLVVDRTSGYEIRFTSAATRVNETVMLDVNGSTSVLSGTLNQNLYTVRTWGAITNNDRMGTWYPGVTPSRAQIQLVENPSLTLTTSSNAVFGNIQVNVTPPSILSLTSDVYVERMEYLKGLIYLKGYNLKVDNLWNFETGIFENSAANSYLRVANNGRSGNSMIYTDGKASDGGLTIKITDNTQAENQPNILNNFGPITYPLGFTPNGGTTLYFRPAQMVVKGYSSPGYVTIRPVAGALPTTNQTGGEVLQHYWRVSHSGFTTVPTVAYRFYYRNQIGTANVDLQTGAANEANYVPGKVLDENPYTRQYEPLANNDIIKNIGTTNTRAIVVNGTASVNGAFNPAVSGISLENANYTAGVANRFTGSVYIYYTRDNEQQAPWNTNATWTRSDILNTAYSPHDSRQPSAGSVPGPGDVAVIGWIPWTDTNRGAALRGQPHGIFLNDTREVAEVVFTKMTDAGGNPVSRVYRSNFQFRPTLCINAVDGSNGILRAKLVKGEGLFWNRNSDPDYTIMDIGDFAREDSSYVIYENFTNNRTVTQTPALFPNLYISNDGWGGNDHNFTFANNISTTGNVELLGDVNLLLPNGASGDFNVGRNLIMFENQGSGGGARIDFGNTGTARKFIIHGDLLMRNSNSEIHVVNPNATAPLVTHELHVYGNIEQGTTGLSSTGLDLWSGANNDRITLYLQGNSNMTYNLINGTIPDLYRLVVNKGNSISSTAQFNCDFNLNGPTTGAGVPKALELQNGLFIINNAGVDINLTTGNDYFSIPATAGLEVRSGTVNASNNSGIVLDGLLRVSGGNVNMSGADNPIEYSASGKATLNVTGGTLTVGGQIRRSPTSDVGILTYSQSGGTVIAGNNAATQNNRGVFEILNAGSSFTMSGGDLYIARSQTSPTISAFYFDPATVNISNTANIHIGHSSTPGGQTIGIYAGKPLPRLRVNNSSAANPIAKLEIVPATITSLLQIDANTSFDANGLDLTLNGGLTATGTFIPSGNTTYFSGTGTQNIIGNGTALNFYNFDKTSSANVVLNAGNTPLLISNNLSLRSGTLTDNGNTITVRGDVLNDATHTNNGTGDGIVMNGNSAQQLSGNGTFGKLTINNPNGVSIPVGNQLFITRSLKMQSGVLNIGKNLLDLGVNAVIEEASAFSPSNMIETNISFTDNGLRKSFPAGAYTFTYPMGSGGKYTPVRLNISANGNNTGSITVKAANEIHPSVIEDTETTTQIVDKDNALQYYWTLKASGITGFSSIARMRYVDSDIKVGTPYTIADYHTARLLADGSGNWLKFPKTDFDETNKDLVFNFNSTNDASISGDYTAGAGDASLNGAIPDMVSQYETNNNGDWTTSTIWTPNVSGGPRGAIARINVPHTVDVTTNYLAGYMTEVYGTLNLGTTYGHRLGIVNGTGTISLETGDIPAAVYDNFFSSAGGTLLFNGASGYEFLGNISEVNHLTIAGSGEKRFPNNNLTLNGTLTIDGLSSLSLVNYYNRKLSVKGDMNRIGGSFDAGTGANATVAFVSTLTQNISGSFVNSNAFNNLEVNNANGITIANDIEIDRQLLLTNGLITVNNGSTFRLNYGATVSPIAGSASSFVNGVFTKELMNGNSFTFPVGNYSSIMAYGPITLQSVTGPAGINDWKASYFYANASLAGYNTDNFSSPISTVSHSEYWKIEAPAGGASVIRIPLDGSSDVASSLTDLSDLRIVGWNASSSEWEVVGTGTSVSGNATSGLVTTTTSVNYGSYTYFTLASVTPVAASTATITSPSVVNLCNGSSTTITVTFTGEMPYVLTYTAGATTITTPAINASSYNITVSPSSTTVYTLTGVTANGVAGSVTGNVSATLNVSPIPTVLLSSSPVSPVCEGLSITFTATAGLQNYRFRINGLTAQNGSGNTYATSTLAVGTQTIDVIGTNTGGCSATSSAIAMVVNPKPAAAGVISGPASVCRTSSATFTVPAIANATSYVWTKSNGAIGTSSTNSITLSFPNSGTTTITVQGSNTCGTGALSTHTVAVNTASTPGAPGVITAVAEVCKGSSGYVCSVAPVANATSYNWSYSGTGATFSGTGNNVTVDFSPTATNGNITVSATNGCSSTAGTTPFAVTVYTPPTATISPLTPSTCSGTAITITASPSGGTTPYASHIWSGPGAGSLSSTSVTNPSFTNNTGGDYDLLYTVTDAKGCIGSASTTITVFQAPTAYAGADALGLCTGTSPIALSGATASGSYSGMPTWSGTGGTWTQNPNPALATFTPSTPSGSTTATLTLTGANGCATVFDTRDISWSKTPDQPGVFTVSSATVCQGQSTVSYAVTNDPLATSYNWNYNGLGETINGTSSAVTIDFDAIATSGILSVTATNTCGTSIARTLNITVNLQPAITLGTIPEICEGVSAAQLPYTGVTNSPNQYTINYNAAAEASGFTDVTNAALPLSPINMVVPGSAGAATYNATLSVRNSATLCNSPLYPITIIVNPLPETGPVYRQPNN